MSLNKDEIINKVETDSRKYVDDSINYNAENANGVGLVVKVTRVYDGIGLHDGKQPCQWCIERCRENMTLQEAYNIGAFQRHDGCGCLIEYISKKGEKTYQTGKSGPNDWLSEEEFNRRVNYNIGGRTPTPQERIINAAIEMQVRDKISQTLVDAIVDNHEALKYYSPASMKQRLERAGYEVRPLSKGNYKGVPFEKGGGYKINFGGDGIFQYHPERRSHHDGAYWKIKNGEKEFRYDY